MECVAENQVKAGSAGGIEIVVKAINAHIKNVNVCRRGLGALLNMSANNSKKY